MRVFKHPARLPTDREYFLSLLSGTETGFSTTAAIILGLAISGQSVAVTATATFVTVSVQAFNAAAGRYQENKTEKEIDDEEEIDIYKPYIAAGLQFVLHMLSGAILIAPIVLIPTESVALWYVFGLALLMLLLVGLFKGRYVVRNTFLHALDIVFVGLLVMIVGLLAGLISTTTS